MGKGLDACKTLFWVLGQGFEDDRFYAGGNSGNELSQGRRWGRDMLLQNLPGVSFKGASATEPFIGHNGQGVLITGKEGFSLNLLRSDIGDSSGHGWRTEEFKGRNQ